MHELSIAQNIIELSKKQLEKENASKVLQLTIKLGLLSGVEYEALSFALEVSKKDSVLQNTEIILQRIHGKSQCAECNHIFNLENIFDHCPKCKSHIHNIIEGKELKISSMLVE